MRETAKSDSGIAPGDLGFSYLRMEVLICANHFRPLEYARDFRLL